MLPHRRWLLSRSASVIDSGLFFKRLLARNNSARSTSDQPIGHLRNLTETLGAPGTTRWFSILLQPLDGMNAGSPNTYFGFGFGGIHIGKGGGDANYLVENLGGSVVGLVFVVELEFLPGREKLKDYDVRSLIKYQS